MCLKLHIKIQDQVSRLIHVLRYSYHFLWVSRQSDLCHESDCVDTQKHFYATACRHRRHYVFWLSFHPSVHQAVRLKSESPYFNLYMGSLVPPTNWDHFSACLSVRYGRFLVITWKTHERNGLQFGMLMYPDHLQNWIDFGLGLLIFLLLAPLWLSETGQI